MTDKVPCTKNDLAKVEEIFTNVINEKLGDPNLNLNLNKIIQEFRHLLDMSCVVQPSPEDDRESQELKDKIEKSQKKALRLKNTLEVHRNQIVAGVRESIEKKLEENAPRIEDFSEDDISIENDIDEEFQSRLSILDDSIKKLLSTLSEINSKVQVGAQQFDKKATDIESFLNSCA